MKNSELFSTKYSPESFDQIFGNTPLIQMLKYYVENQIKLPHLFCYGSSGVGKSSIFNVFANETKKKSNHVIFYEILTLENLNNLYDKICEINLSTNKNIKYIIIDDITCMNSKLELLLHDIIYKNNRIRFILLCNNRIRLKPFLLNLFLEIPIYPMILNDSKLLAQYILKKEFLFNKYDENVICNIYSIVNGDIRKFLNLLQYVYYSDNNNHLNTINMEQVLRKIISFENNKEAVIYINKIIVDFSMNLEDFITDIYNHFIKYSMHKIKYFPNDFCKFSKLIAKIQLNSNKLIKFNIQLYCLVSLINRYAFLIKET